MGKGDDSVMRKKNKAKRKKLNRDNSNVSARVASIIAAKKRRLSGKRRMCQGMCFSLPTPDDPFNDLQGKMDFNVKDKKKNVPTMVNKRVLNGGKKASLTKETSSRNNREINNLEQKNVKLKNSRNEMRKSDSYLVQKNSIVNENTTVAEKDSNCKQQVCGNSDCPSKFFILCLNAIEKALHHEGAYNNEDKPLFVNPWGVEFLKCFSMGKDILETSGSCCTIEQIAWIVSIAADAIARKEKEGLSLATPFLLFLVPSQDKAAKVRLVCKPLKDLGVHTVSLHPGTSLDHQIHGLKSCEPEFIVSTPERLLELVSLKAIDISRVSFLVVDGLDSLNQDASLSTLNSIRQLISGNPNTLVFNNSSDNACVPALQNLLSGEIYRLSLNNSVCSQSACIVQNINVCSSAEEKLLKGIQVLNGAYDNRQCTHQLRVLYVVEKDHKSSDLVKALEMKGYSVSNGDASDADSSLDTDRTTRPVISVINTEDIGAIDLGIYEVVILPNFLLSIDNYIQILTRMARYTTRGILHGFLTGEDAMLAGPLIEILEQCGQTVPEALRTL